MNLSEKYDPIAAGSHRERRSESGVRYQTTGFFGGENEQEQEAKQSE